MKSLEQAAALHEATGKPIMLGGTEGKFSREALAGAGVRIALQGHQPVMAAIRAVAETLAALRAGTSPAALDNQPTPALLKQVTRQAGYDAAAREFLGGA